MFTAKQLQDFKAYRKVQMGGKWNMFAAQARRATGLSESDYIFVLKNYIALRKEIESGLLDN